MLYRRRGCRLARGAAGVGGAAGPGYRSHVADQVTGARAELTRLKRWHGRAHDAAAHRLAQEADHAEEIARVLAAFADTAAAAGTGTRRWSRHGDAARR